MKRTILSLLLILTILSLSGCSIDWDNQKKEKIVELEKQIKNDIFGKKEQCMNYKDKMLEFAKNYYKTNEYNSQIEIHEIFYSKIKESCYFITILKEDKNTFKSIFDFLGQKLYMQQSYYEYSDKLDNEITILKGE